MRRILETCVFLILISLTNSCISTKPLRVAEENKYSNKNLSKLNLYLANHYSEFAKECLKKEQRKSYEIFSRKALKASMGFETWPEDLQLWDVQGTYLADMLFARSKIAEFMLDKQISNSYPELAANGQFNFDCWVEFRSHPLNDGKFTDCKNQFEYALAKLEELKNTKELRSQIFAKLKNHERHLKPPIEKSYLVHYKNGNWKEDKTAKQILNTLLNELDSGDGKKYKVWLQPITNGKEFKRFKHYLSKLRITAIRQYLYNKIGKENIVDLESDIDISSKKSETSRVEIYLKEIIDYSNND